MKQKLSRIQQSYPNAECPDCGERIPKRAEHGDECKSCGHVFYIDLVETGEMTH